MKTNEYIRKYKLNEGLKELNHSTFIQDFTTDFLTALEIGRNKEGYLNIKGFENSVRAIRQKWDGIDKKTMGQMPEKLWNYFYATVIAKMKNELFPEEMAARKAKKDAWDKRWARNEKREQQQADQWRKLFFASLFAGMAKPNEAFKLLRLTEEATAEDVKRNYRQMSMIHHPDKGGNPKMFLEITEAKNKCLSYLNE